MALKYLPTRGDVKEVGECDEICVACSKRMISITYQARSADEPARHVKTCTSCPLNPNKLDPSQLAFVPDYGLTSLWLLNETRLREAKFQLELAPDARSEIDWLRTDNKRVKKDHLSMLLLDLKNGHIILRRITTPSAVPKSSVSQAAPDRLAQPSPSEINTQSSRSGDGENHQGDDN
ncbi:hypothetical protein PTTG_25482 [Puccinia triticina 1-1 BBBD Race 1]|uniref:TFIIS-type domain-containing protein n=1 Tax=Puccinia triticina (isolate 1-1 / race 1 (BBBD)) TaxID=630390 RepID=A0A180H2G3_PUCT1|nr:hypothetical protein PTTG_25482 [Puccinia triticina 1-1 BBBD Race 1]WAR54489.1 hypothetical protein PtB15_4B106 [Puccinia triticina]